MIPRYSRPQMVAVFAPERRLELWLEIELLVAEAMAGLGQIDGEAVARLRTATEQARDRLIDAAAVEAIEATTRHDVIAFLTHVENLCGADARLLHLGMTSSDLLDTTLALQLREAGQLVLADLDALLAVLARRAREHAMDVCIGRSHGIHAEPTTFGLKLAGFHAAFARQRQRLLAAIEDVSTCAISGAVGTFANIDPAIEARVAGKLGLRVEPVSTQVIPRDRHAAFACALAQIAGSIEHLATEIRHLQRSEVREVEEFFHAGQKGSSAMPHKRNPVLSENLTGLARMIRAAVVPALENVALWHERDISHSSVERVMLPDSCILADFALARLAGLMDRLVVHPERMRRNLDATHGLFNSQTVLLALVDAGMGRQAAYELVQASAMRAWENEEPLLDLLEVDPRITAVLDEKSLADLFDPARHTRHVPMLLERALAVS
ncbi:MAG: adenylosuccinate lyase [Geminicoccaceae bacterium]|mgnify:CR=1 FL=1|jgi:adenylosuccinate lyase|nr:adenylosuccinate lyase [Geminicoccaceae bacterium]HRY25648.1 adenylosuccinate lyase [Geminicoccaceae bacterium]